MLALSKAASTSDLSAAHAPAVCLGIALALLITGCSNTAEDDMSRGLWLGGSAGAQAGTGAGVAGSVAPTSSPMPCAVQAVVQNNCQSCHGANPIGGAPMSLLTHEDFSRDYMVRTTTSKIGQTHKLYELARFRLNDAGAPMPPRGAISDADRAVLDGWLAAGAPSGTDADRVCTSSGAAGTGGSGGTGGGAGTVAGTGGAIANPGHDCDASAYEPMVPREGETCYEFVAHSAQSLPDATPYTIKPGENYEQFYFDVPWPAGVLASRMGANFDNLSVLHHWLLFTTGLQVAHGSHETTIGSQLGDNNAQLIGGWAVGGCNIEFPAGMGLELPPPGTSLNLQLHYSNSAPTDQTDASVIVLCTKPAAEFENVGSLTWLGTENFNGPLGMPQGKSEFGGTCVNDSGAPITIVGFWPHMHKLGRHMRSAIHRGNGMTQEVFTEQFDFNQQVHYMVEPGFVLAPNESITSTCTFQNDTGANVAFGPSTDQEMCYQFAFSYPARALDNGVASLIGATNTCW